MDKVAPYLKLITKLPLVSVIHKRTGVPQEQISKMAVGAFSTFCMTSKGSQICSFFVGTVYPTYMSCMILDASIESDISERELYNYWLIWVFVTRMEFALSSVIPYVPLYNQIRLCILITNIFNSFKLSNHLFETGMIPLYEYSSSGLTALREKALKNL